MTIPTYDQAFPAEYNLKYGWGTITNWQKEESGYVERRLLDIETAIGKTAPTDTTCIRYRLDALEAMNPDNLHSVTSASESTAVPVGYFKRLMEDPQNDQPPTFGCGGYVPYYLHNADFAEKQAARFQWIWTNATGGSENCALIISSMSSGGISPTLIMYANSEITKVDSSSSTATLGYTFARRWPTTTAASVGTGMVMDFSLPYAPTVPTAYTTRTASSFFVAWTDVTLDHECSKVCSLVKYNGHLIQVCDLKTVTIGSTDYMGLYPPAVVALSTSIGSDVAPWARIYGTAIYGGTGIFTTSGVLTQCSDANVTTPTASELDTAFGAKSDGWLGILDDNAGASNVWLVARKNGYWWTFAGTKATNTQ